MNSWQSMCYSSIWAENDAVWRATRSPPFFCKKNGERSRKASLHCAVRHNFTQKTKFFLHIFTKLQRSLACEVAPQGRLWRRYANAPLVKRSVCAAREVFSLREQGWCSWLKRTCLPRRNAMKPGGAYTAALPPPEGGCVSFYTTLRLYSGELPWFSSFLCYIDFRKEIILYLQAKCWHFSVRRHLL